MPAPTQQQARSQHAQQAAIAVTAASAVTNLLRLRRSWAQILNTIAQYQLAAATSAVRAMAQWADDETPMVNPRPFAGVSSAGFPISEPLIAAIDAKAPAPVEALPAAWWDDAEAFMADAARVIEGQVKDAARSAAQAELVARPDWQNYVRMLTPPSCKRCVVLAGRIYRDLEGFSRHPPTCDCIHVPVQDWEEAHDKGLVSSPMEAFEKGHIRDLTKAEHAAIAEGANISQVINSSRGMYTADVFGRRVKATTVGTTKRAAWRRANPSRLVRLRPESLLRMAEGATDDERRADFVRLLGVYGYIT